MSLIAVCLGNFHQLRNNLANNCHVKLLKSHAGLFCRKLLDSRMCERRPLTTRVEASQKSSHSTRITSTQLELRQISQNRIERPATILVFDVETTGFSRQNDRIIELALRDLMGGKNSTFETLLNPEKDVLNAFVHGISSDLVSGPGVPRFKELVPILLQYVQSRQATDKPVLWVAHNGRQFDVPFFVKEFERCSTEIPADWLFVDTLPLARQLVKSDGSKLRSSSLKALRVHYDVPLASPAHRAMQDVTTLCHVFQKITFDLKLTIKELMDRAFRASDITKLSPSNKLHLSKLQS